MKLNPQLLRLNRNLLVCCVISALVSAFVAQMLAEEESYLNTTITIRWVLMFYFLEIELEPFAASLVSEAIATLFYIAVVSAVIKATKVY